MKIDFRFHSISHIVKHVFGHFLWVIKNNKCSELLVLNYHGTQQKFIFNFEEQILFLLNCYEFVSPKEFENLLNSKKKCNGRKILLTFDDGIRNNKRVLDILRKYNISAMFFIIPGFIDAPESRQKEYFLKNIRPVTNKHIDCEDEDFQSLTWEDVMKLSEDHTIGCHSYNHIMDVASSKEELSNEIVESKIRIEKKCGFKITSFCSINNTSLSVNKVAFSMILDNYQNHYTTFPGDNLFGDGYLVRRINIESHWLSGAIKLALNPIDWLRWSNKFNSYRKYISN